MSYTIFTPPIFDQYLADIYGFLNSQSGIFIKSYQSYHPTISGQKISSQGHLRSFNTFWIYHQKMANFCLPSGLKFCFRNYEFFRIFLTFGFKWFKFKYNPVKQRALIKNPKRLIKNFEIFFSRFLFFSKILIRDI